MRLGSLLRRERDTQGATGVPPAKGNLNRTPEQSGGRDPVVVTPDPAPLRWWIALRRSGRSEGRRNELYVLRLLVLVGAFAALAALAPGGALFLAIIVAIIVVHESGHYVVARRCGMRPTEFFVGFGPTVWARRGTDGLRYGVKLLPLGGYVKIPGMGPAEEVEASLEPYTYRSATRPRRMAVILAGSIANLVLAMTLFWGFAMTSPTVDTSPVKALNGSVELTTTIAGDTVTALGRLVTGAGDYARSVADGEAPKDRMVSAIGGAQLTDGLLDDHPSRLLLLAGLFSASIGVLNLLPLLPLDGGHAILIVAESAMARLKRQPRYRIDPNTFRPVALAVVTALVLLGATSMYIDIIHPLSITS